MTKRRTHCPAGRVLYRYGDLPATLATRTMLKRMRHVLAEGQQPVASLLYAGNEYAPLYEIAAAAAMPALSPGRQAAWVARHTCVRCAAAADARFGPYRPDRRAGRRLCERCHTLEAEARWRAGQLGARTAAVVWARGVLADPRVVVLAPRPPRKVDGTYRLYAASVAGEVLLDAVVAPLQPAPHARIPAAAVSAVSLLDQLREIGRRRRIGWLTSTRWDDVWWDMPVATPKPPRLHIEHDDDLAGRYSDWLGKTTPRWSYRYATAHGAPQKLQPGSPREHVDTMLGILRQLAGDEHPDGPPRCPALGSTGLQACGRTQLASDGFCVVHHMAGENHGE